jgi:hypothetical protein
LFEQCQDTSDGSLNTTLSTFFDPFMSIITIPHDAIQQHLDAVGNCIAPAIRCLGFMAAALKSGFEPLYPRCMPVLAQRFKSPIVEPNVSRALEINRACAKAIVTIFANTRNELWQGSGALEWFPEALRSAIRIETNVPSFGAVKSECSDVWVPFLQSCNPRPKELIKEVVITNLANVRHLYEDLVYHSSPTSKQHRLCELTFIRLGKLFEALRGDVVPFAKEVANVTFETPSEARLTRSFIIIGYYLFI